MKIILLSLLVMLSACSGKDKEIRIQGETMGTYYKITTYGSESPDELKKEVDEFLKLFNNIFSTYIPGSEIFKINTSKFRKVKLSNSMRKLIEQSLEISRKSQGYFDITVAPLVNLWGFGPDGKKKKPTDEEIQETKKSVGFHHIDFQDKFIVKKVPGLKLDMSAVAKGFGVDELVKYLEYQGYSNLLVEIGGEVRTRGSKPENKPWRVGIEGPGKDLATSLSKVVTLTNMSMATSGSYRNYLKYGDEIFNHTIDPKTGKPVNHKTISVSVISEFCADADAWATALMSMGHEKGLDVANKLGLIAYFQIKEDDKVEVLTSNAFEKYK
tara:strand:+ start:2371 stop:3351 length:981 start_codon:yes stop_codon:yes gene_type:complete